MDRRRFVRSGAALSVASAAAFAMPVPARAATRRKSAMSQHFEQVKGLITDWRRKDIAAVLGRVTDDIDWHTVSSLPSGSTQSVVGATVFAITGFGLSWANSGADYSRYLPRDTSGRSVVGWTTFGSVSTPDLFRLVSTGLSHTRGGYS